MQLVTATGPAARLWASAAYDPLRDAVVLFAGQSGADYREDMWEFHNNQWQELQPRTRPVASYAAYTTYDVTTSSITLFGGANATFYNDTWRWRWTNPGASDQACPAVGAPGNIDTDGDGLDSDHDPDCWWRRTPNCPPGTSCP
jgi:hypothetical protein